MLLCCRAVGVVVSLSTSVLKNKTQLIRKYYERNHGMSLERAIKKECSGSFETMLLAMLQPPIAYYALQVKSYQVIHLYVFICVYVLRSAVTRMVGIADTCLRLR